MGVGWLDAGRWATDGLATSGLGMGWLDAGRWADVRGLGVGWWLDAGRWPDVCGLGVGRWLGRVRLPGFGAGSPGVPVRGANGGG